MAVKRKPHCPICKVEVGAANNKYFPFCGERCQMVDLGRWLNEGYSVPAPITERDIGTLERLMEAQQEED